MAMRLVYPKHSGGDIIAITLLQSAARLSGGGVSGATIVEVAGYIPDDKIKTLYDLCLQGKFDEVQNHMEDILRDLAPKFLTSSTSYWMQIARMW